MQENEFLCVALFTAKENKESELTDELNQLVQKTVQEPGCISYELFTSNQDPRKVLVHEVYKSEDDFKVHSESEYLKAFMKLASDLVDSVQVKTA